MKGRTKKWADVEPLHQKQANEQFERNDKSFQDDWPDFKCRHCGRYKPQEPSEFRCGDAVAFNEVLQLTRGTQVRMMGGVIVEEYTDSVLILITGSKSTELVSRTEIRMTGAPGPLVYELFGVCRCGSCE